MAGVNEAVETDKGQLYFCAGVERGEHADRFVGIAAMGAGRAVDRADILCAIRKAW